MMIYVCGIYVVLILLGMWIMVRFSPMGWEDKNGFHRGKKG